VAVDPLAERFVQVILDELRRQDLSISELARRIDIPQQTVSELLNHPRTVNTSTIVRYLEALGLSPRLEVDLGVYS